MAVDVTDGCAAEAPADAFGVPEEPPEQPAAATRTAPTRTALPAARHPRRARSDFLARVITATSTGSFIV
jgi:hypothetical protein